MGDAAQGLPGKPAVRRLPRHAGARRRAGVAEVGDLVPGQPGASAADCHRGHLPVRCRERRAADAARCPFGHGAAHRRGGGRGRAGAGPAECAHGRGSSAAACTATWAARCLAAAGLRAGSVLRSSQRSRPCPGAELDWDSGSRELALRSDIVCCVTPGAEIVVEAGDLARAAPQHAGRRRAAARPRPRSKRWPRARCSATSGSRRPTAAS